MKAQLTIQYLASFIFFIGLIIYIYFAYSANIPQFIEEVNKEDVRSKAYQLSEVLINDPGQPINWNSVALSLIKRIGFSDQNTNKTNMISYDKLNKFSDEFGDCTVSSNFTKVQNRLSLNNSFSFYIFNITDDGERQILARCVPPVFPKTVINATVKRITAWNQSGVIKLAEVIVQM